MRVLHFFLIGALASLLFQPMSALAETPANTAPAATPEAGSPPAVNVPTLLARPATIPKVVPRVPTETENQIDTVTDALTLVRMAKQFELAKDWRHQAYALAKLFAMRPMQGTVGYELAAAYARQDDKRNAYDVLIRLQSTGYGFDPSKDARFEKIKGTRVWDYVVLNLQANLTPFGGGRAGFNLPAGDTLFESIGYDPVRKQFVVASVREGTIYLADGNGATTPFIVADATNGLLASYGLGVDAPRDLLWVIGNGVPHKKGIVQADFGRSVLYKFSLSTGKLIAKYEVPIAHRPSLLSSITVSPKGDVVVADGVSRRIYQLAGEQLQMIVENPRLTSIRGMVFDKTSTKLYFADYDLGLFGIDLNTGKPFAVAPEAGLTLYSIEGLAWWNDQLIAVQNGFPPARVMRLQLDETGTRVKHAQALDAAKPEFGLPTQGVVVGDAFWFIANSQRGHYDSFGIPKDVAKLKPVHIYRSDITFAVDSGKGKLSPAAAPMPAKQ
ncbi:MAG TPA: hypothetical protein PLQ74_09910 [Pseudomonadota bacterium]|nr:hypothetical protein [Xanthomonadales bacterium]HQW82170.1 hypothetical protein [Pseudomonadota bacterium]